MNDFIVVIPARLASSRLPRKALADIGGLPMVVRVAKQAQKSRAKRVIIATDHAEILQACEQYQIEACLTRADHQSGTDRIAELVELFAWADDEMIVNVQGDEPLISPDWINQVADKLAQSGSHMATLAQNLSTLDDFLNPNIVKVVKNAQDLALYFSRAPIPYPRDAFAADKNALPVDFPALRHMGLYAYRAAFLRQYAALTPAPLESLEALEQLRVLWHGFTISLATVSEGLSLGVDTLEDLEEARRLFFLLNPKP